MSNYTTRKLSLNIVFAVLQIFVSAVVLFFLYRYAIVKLGIRNFGIWSVVSTSITSLSILNYGLSGSLVKYVAKYKSIGADHKVLALIETSVLSVIAFAIILGVVGFLAFSLILDFLFKDAADILLAKELLKICLITFFTTIVASAFQAALEGLNYMFIKSLISCIISITLLICSFIFLDRYGIVGLAYAYLISSIVGLILSITALKVKFQQLRLISWKWDFKLFKETLRYNYNFQVISVFSLLNDPITKFILTKFGGVEYAGLYELATKLVMQARSVLSAANQAVVPMFANLKETNAVKTEAFYKTSFLYIFIFSTLIFSAIMAYAPVLSVWCLGGVDHTFILFMELIAISWFINSVAMPAYFANLGKGDMKWNTWSHVGMGACNLVLSLAIGFFADALFICLGWFLSLSFFSFLIIVMYNKENGIKLKEIMPGENWLYLAANIILSSLLVVFFLNEPGIKNVMFVLVSIAYLLIQFYLLSRHTMLASLKLQVAKYFAR